jgi:peptidoglycan/xylan/chitin deacetylase (PgdA/CDA1 family)
VRVETPIEPRDRRSDAAAAAPRGAVGRIAALAHRGGLTDRILRWQRTDRLTVLCYHRVAEPEPGRFQGFRTNISATPQGFREQIAYLARHFTPIALHDLHAFLAQGRTLPPRPVLVTFDDGYRDNGTVAWPILRALGVPAAVFLATDHVGTDRPFVWDYAAACIEGCERPAADLPLLGARSLSTPAARQAALTQWMEALKAEPDAAKGSHAEALATALGIAPPADLFQGLTLSWDEVRRLCADGLEFGGHTRSHPVLTRMPDAAARGEFAGSHARLARETGRAPVAFAYPNGRRSDFTAAHEAMARDAGYAFAFSMEPGPLALDAVARAPFAIRRIYVGLDDDLPRFALKLAGAARLRARVRGPTQGGTSPA